MIPHETAMNVPVLKNKRPEINLRSFFIYQSAVVRNEASAYLIFRQCKQTFREYILEIVWRMRWQNFRPWCLMHWYIPMARFFSVYQAKPLVKSFRPLWKLICIINLIFITLYPFIISKYYPNLWKTNRSKFFKRKKSNFLKRGWSFSWQTKVFVKTWCLMKNWEDNLKN